MTTQASPSTTTPTVPAQAGEPRPSLDPQIRLDLYTTMVLCRTYEEAILREYHADKGPGFDIGKGLVPGEMHLSAGQEPVAAGVCAQLTVDDAVTATHRPHHLAIAHGVDLRAMTAEIFGREDGLGRGRGGHMHLFDPSTHFSCSGIIAEGYPPALGQAFAFQRKGTDRVAVAVTGEGAANQGGFHESLNLAARWSLPVVFVVEDNDWGISVPREASTAVSSNAARAAAYGIPGERVEDNDVEAVYGAARGWSPGPAPARDRPCSRCTRCACGGTSRATRRATAPSWPRSPSTTRSRATSSSSARLACWTTRRSRGSRRRRAATSRTR